MASLRDSLARLEKLRGLFEKRLAAASGKPGKKASHRPGRLREIVNFGANPGNLRMHAYVPPDLAPSPSLVVALHGCTQTADIYDHGAGWSDLADRLGFAVIYPEQLPVNNPKNCFSWFLPGDSARESGEALSICHMIEKAVAEFGVDRSRIFVTGLSAGGAMASVMLATYPEVFAGGAIIAGLPYGCASSVQEAFEAMFNDRAPSPRALGDRVRAASRHRGPWPRISVWHGTADQIVKPSNGGHIVSQWLNLQGLPAHPSGEENLGRHMRRVWNGADGAPLIEAFSVAGMAHGVPLATSGADACGIAGPFFLDTGLSSTCRIARFWGLDTAETREQTLSAPSAASRVPAAPALYQAARGPGAAPVEAMRVQDADAHLALDPVAVIAAAFKAAGLPTPEQNGKPGTVDPGAIIAAALKAAGLSRE